MKGGIDEAKRNRAEIRRIQLRREDAESVLRRRLAERDEAYAASPCAPRVIVERVRTTNGRPLRIEHRGQRMLGAFSM